MKKELDILKAKLKESKKLLKSMESEAKKEDELWDDRDFLAAYNDLLGFVAGLEFAIDTLEL